MANQYPDAYPDAAPENYQPIENQGNHLNYKFTEVVRNKEERKVIASLPGV